MNYTYFDIETAVRDANIPAHILKQIKNEAKAEFHHDPMMYELHVLRAIKSRFWIKAKTSAPIKKLVAA